MLGALCALKVVSEVRESRPITEEVPNASLFVLAVYVYNSHIVAPRIPCLCRPRLPQRWPRNEISGAGARACSMFRRAGV